MSNQTNKELLELVLIQTKENAKNQLNFAGKVSTFMNEQNLFNAEIKGYLESNDRTNQKGLVEQVKVNTYEINEIKTEKKVDKAKIGVIGVIVGAILTFVSKIFF
tara:strand:+ start:44 stop:358 length:315 start_codon:yes stop_codon:yes gene_type:complete